MNQYWLMYEANRKAQQFEMERERIRWQQSGNNLSVLFKPLLMAVVYVVAHLPHL